MKSNLIKIEREEDDYLLFNKRGMVLELSSEEFALFEKYADEKYFPDEEQQFFNQLCSYEMLDFEDYTAKDVPVQYSQKLLHHNSAEPAFKSPIIAHLGITQKCNMGCEYCSVREMYGNMEELSTEEWKGVIRKLSGFGVFQIGFTGGEPTLRIDLVELAQYVSEQDCTFNLTTNCWKLDESLVEQLKDAGMRQAQLSLDCHLPEINDALRAEGSLRKVEEAIGLLQKHQITVGIDCVVSQNNLAYLPQFVEWLGDREVPYLTLIKIKQGDLPLERFKELLPGYFEYSQLVEQLCNRDNQNPCVTLDCGSVSNLEYTLTDEELSKVPIAGCPVGHTLLSISPNGDIYPCVALSGERFRIGNALTDNLEEVWDNDQTLRELRQVKSKVDGQCGECGRLDHCRAGCRGIAYSLYDNLWESDKTCLRESLKKQGGEKNGSESG